MKEIALQKKSVVVGYSGLLAIFWCIRLLAK